MSLREQWVSERQQRTQRTSALLESSRRARQEKQQALRQQWQQEQQARQQRLAEMSAGIQEFQGQRQQVRQQTRQAQSVQKAQADQARRQACIHFSEQVKQSIEHLSQSRQEMSVQLHQALQSFASQLTAETSTFLGSTQQARAAACVEQQAELQAFHQALQAQVAEQINHLTTTRQTNAAQIREELTAFTENLRVTIWGTDGIPTRSAPVAKTTQPQPSVNGLSYSAASSAASSDTLEAAQAVLSDPGLTDNLGVTPEPEQESQDEGSSVGADDEALIAEMIANMNLASVETQSTEQVLSEDPTGIWDLPPDGLDDQSPWGNGLVDQAVSAPETLAHEPSEQDIIDYVNACVMDLQSKDPSLTLLQVIGNRDLVRDLLTQGANDLGVDPSEILSALRHLVATPVTV